MVFIPERNLTHNLFFLFPILSFWYSVNAGLPDSHANIEHLFGAAAGTRCGKTVMYSVRELQHITNNAVESIDCACIKIK